ncbi:MAG: hypothetical protein OEZ09_03180 [Betaproteobacteria bacterium]|nr:hypothetical protein [Betaproteobacteria bacterium]
MFGNVARSRLLPMSLPFRLLGAAVAFQVAAWALLLLHGRELGAFAIGLGPVFAALHLVTLGVLAMAAVGATLQLLPVATRQPVRAQWAAKLAWWLLVPGVALFAAGAAAYRPTAMAAGAATATLALGIYGVLLFANLRGARGMRVVVAHGWAALACLVLLTATGLALVARYEHGVALDHLAFRNAHLVLAAYGFMGLLAFGLSNFLLPMLAVAPPPPARSAYFVLGAAVAAIAAGVAGWQLPAALLGLVAAGLHIVSLERALAARLRAPLGVAFLMVRASWACLLASLALAALMALDLAPARAPVLFGLLLVPGWLLTFLLGVLQRIVPFLASVHALSGGRPLASSLTPQRLLAAHAVLHLGALALLVAGLHLPGAAIGLGAALAYAAFFVYVLVKARHHGIRPRHQPATA